MVSMPAWSCNPLPLAALVLLASCSRAAPVKTSAPGPTLEAGTSDDEVTIEGAYTCEFYRGSEALVGPCAIEQSSEGGLLLQMALGSHRLQGALTRTDYGFHLEGRFNEEAVESDFMRQGGKSFATVLQLADQSLCKINMAPGDSAPSSKAGSTSAPTDN